MTARSLSLGLISLDFDGLDELYDVAFARSCAHVEIFLDVDATEADRDLILRGRERGIDVASVSSLAKLALAADSDAPAHQELVRRSIDLAAEVGAPFATFMYGSGYDVAPEAARDRFVRRLEPLVEHAADRGVGLLVENVFSRAGPGDLDTVDATLELFERLDTQHVGLNFDPANFTIAGEEAYPRAYRELRPLVRSMHLKDIRPLTDADAPLGTRRVMEDYRRGPFLVVPLGEGQVGIDALLGEFADEDREVVISLEPTAKGEDRERWLDASLAYLHEHGVAPTTPARPATEVAR